MDSVIRLLAVAAASLVALGLITFAADRSRHGSDEQVRAVDSSRPRPVADEAINRPTPPAAVERRRERRHSDARELIDDANDYLLSPFAFASSENVWVERMVPAALGLLAYGLGGMLLANFLPKHRSASRNWREATP